MPKKYLAECIGTFGLSFVVLAAAGFTGTLPVAVPVIAGLALALFVYTIGHISGCHINPAVTLGQLSVGKVSMTEAIGYIGAQIAGAIIAVILGKLFVIISPFVPPPFEMRVFLAEMVGAFFFNFGIASAVYGKTHEHLSGLVVGGSLLLGSLVASFSGAVGILNPAVALALSSLSIVYLFAPIVGAIAGFQVYRYIASEQ